MSKIETMSRVLIDHNWTSIDEWVRAVRDLADFDDQALIELERTHGRQSREAAE